MEATIITFPRIDSNTHPIRGDHKPRSSPPRDLASLNRVSALALGVLLLLILVAIIWVTHSRIKRRRAHNPDIESLPTHDPRMGIYQKRIFRVDRKDSRQPPEAWPKPVREEEGREDRKGSVATLPRYEPRRINRLSGMGQTERDRRLWGSLTTHGSTAKADRDEQELPPLPPSPTLSSLSYDDRGIRSSYRSLSRASVYTNPRECSIVGQDWMPFPPRHVQSLDRADWIEGFRGVAWETERQGRGVDDGVMSSMRRNTVSIDPGEPASTSRDWAVGKV